MADTGVCSDEPAGFVDRGGNTFDRSCLDLVSMSLGEQRLPLSAFVEGEREGRVIAHGAQSARDDDVLARCPAALRFTRGGGQDRAFVVATCFEVTWGCLLYTSRCV